MKLLICIFLTGLFAILQSQPQFQWQQRYNGSGNIDDFASSMAVDASGNVFIGGSSADSGTIRDFATVKYNSSGVQQWALSYNGPGNGYDVLNDITVDNAGNVIVTGTSEGNGTSGDFTTIKYNSSGVQQWVARYNDTTNSYDEGIFIAVDALGNIYATGYSGTAASCNYVTIKYNPSGVQLWVRIYNGPGNDLDIPTAMVIDSLGNVYVTGISIGSGTIYDFATIKYSPSGVQQWVTRYNGPQNGHDEAQSIAVDEAGNVYVTGDSYGDYATIKYNPSGIQQWVSFYNGPGNSFDKPTSIALDNSGNTYVTGLSDGGISSYDFATVKYNSSGVQQWVQRFEGNGNDFDQATSIAVGNNGFIYVTGFVTGVFLNYDYQTIIYNASGTQMWTAVYNGPGNGDDVALAVAVDAAGSLYVTGTSIGFGSSSDFLTIKYANTVGIEPKSSGIPEKFSLSQNYPNPFNPSTKIKFDIPEQLQTKLVVFDITGRVVKTLVDETLNAGSYEINFSAKELSSGVYFYRVTAGKFADLKKMMIVK